MPVIRASSQCSAVTNLRISKNDSKSQRVVVSVPTEVGCYKSQDLQSLKAYHNPHYRIIIFNAVVHKERNPKDAIIHF